MQLPITDPSEQSAAHSVGLLVNLFQGKMRIAALFSCLSIPIDDEWVSLYSCAIDFGNGDAAGAQGRDLALFQDENTTRMLEDGGGVRSKELLVFAQPDDERNMAACS